jgi:hypothetical protein
MLCVGALRGGRPKAGHCSGGFSLVFDDESSNLV